MAGPRQRAHPRPRAVHSGRRARPPEGGTTVTAPTLPVPKNADELAEILADPKRSKDVLANRETLTSFIRAYAEQQQGDGTELHRTVAEETQRALTAYLRDRGETSDVKRLNLDPQTRPTGMAISHRQATAYNAAAVGAKLDN